MTHLDHAEERDLDARFDAQQDRLADERDERDRLGFDVGDQVTVGKGTKVWRLASFWHAHDGQLLATLDGLEGYAHTSVAVDRLKAVA